MAIVKEVSFNREKLYSGINIIADAVKSTLGARGKTVLMESENHIGGLTVTKDGISVANAITLLDPTENLAVTLMKQAADKTATVAGDGTTTAIVLTQAIVLEAQKLVKERMNTTEIIRAIRSASEVVTGKLTKMSKPVSEKNLRYVATISANGDKEIGRMIADAYSKVGKKGTVTVDMSRTTDTYSEITSGMRVDRGWSAPQFVTDTVKQECVMDGALVMVTDKTIETLSSIEHLLKYSMESKRPLLIIGELSEHAMQALVINKMRGIVKVCHITPPQFGYRRSEVMQDIACATGAKYFSDATGDNFELFMPVDLGYANKIICGRGHTTIMTDSEHNDISDRIAMIEEELAEQTTPHEVNFLKERIASLSGGVGVIYVGAGTDIERKEKKDRVDDAVCATAAALEAGILPGGGIALMDVSASTSWGSNESERVAWHILQSAMLAPFRQILSNGGIPYENIEREIRSSDPGTGYDVSAMTIGNMVKMGIVDPAKVTINALENAVSVATTIMSTNCIITNVRQS